MLNYLLAGDGDWRSYAIHLLLSLPIILFALSVHEMAHGFIAYKLGDPTARNLGRLTVNPLKHLDPIGFLCMILFGYGWAHPVPINSRHFKKPRRDMALTALAGPVSNLLSAIVFAVLYGVSDLVFVLNITNGWITNEALLTLMQYINVFFYYGVSLNVTLAVFNLLPIPPLDGSRIVSAFLPPMAAYKYMKYERYISLALMALLILTPLSDLIHMVTGAVTVVFLLIAELPFWIAGFFI